MAPTTVPAAALLTVMAVAPCAAFVAPISTPASPGLRRGAASGESSTFGATAQTVGSLAAVAGIAIAARRRTARRTFDFIPNELVDRAQKSRTSTASALMHIQPRMRWFFDGGKTPVPGSEKALAVLVGKDVEMGDVPWDPMGFSKLFDRNFEFNKFMTYPHVQWLRESEVKHGRVCMLAILGIAAQSFGTITPPYPAEHNWTKVLDQCYADPTARVGIVQISAVIMMLDCYFFPFDAWIGQMDREPGDWGFDPLKLSKKPDFDMKAMQLKELKNGRLAMIGMAAAAAAVAIPGSVPSLGAFASKAASAVSPAFCGQTRVSARPVQDATKTAAKYTTQVILPALTWLKSGVKSSELAPTELRAKLIAGNDVLIGKTEAGKVFAVGNLCPHINTPMSEGADVIGDIIVCPLHGSSFKTTTGELLDWCPSPPIIGPLTGLIIEKKNLLVYEVREGGFFSGGEIEVLVDTNAKKAYEAYYWKGLLDAQGKDDGTYY